ncbi:MAG TPA: adenylate/guanylate cyclase domain-containing protein, partial [Ktedonobacterales bacterium]|nr:adenylate/guanylate cyclase domain-containing protein [Ktedonobacterales bacterium]
ASIASGVVTADMLGVVTAFNRAAERIFGLVGASAVGRPYQEVLASIGDEELAEIMRRAVTEREVTLGHEIARRLPERGEIALRLNVSPLRSGEGAGEALGVAMVVDDLTELRRSQQQAREIQRLFGRYVHPAVVRQLLADPSAVNLGGETREISVVFADIRGYTRLAEQAAPGELMRMLNSYLNILTEAIWQQEGTLTMFIGDALMAIFNAPLSQPDHALRAVRAAWAMRRALERQAAGCGPEEGRVEYGIGVHTGIAVVGNIGAADRLQNYTAIGDAVNTAQRLQANASANQILLSSATYLEVARAVVARALEPLTVKGKTQPLTVYQLDGLR